MLNIGFQFFAHKKGGGSTKNGRDSESKRLGAKTVSLFWLATFLFAREARTSIRATTSVSARTIRCSL